MRLEWLPVVSATSAKSSSHSCYWIGPRYLDRDERQSELARGIFQKRKEGWE